MINLLGKEQVCKNIMKKLLQLNFPARQAKIIVDDIFGNSFPGNKTADSKDGLVESETLEEFQVRVEELKGKWRIIEKDYTRNDPPNKFVNYFEKCKEKPVREKMTNFFLKAANEVSRSLHSLWSS